MMTTDLAQRQAAGALSIPSNFAEYAPISRYTGEPTELPSTPDWLATISAGKRIPGKQPNTTIPSMNRDGHIELHDPDGRAPGLAEALAATDHKRLTIAFVSNNLSDVIQERIVGYTASTLKYHGDQNAITELTPQGRVVHVKGSPGYAAALKVCTVSRRVFFALARWDDDGTPRVFFPDGLGLYSIRTTSARSTGNIAATLALIARQTGGPIAGLPFALSLSSRQVSDATGTLRTVSLWSMVFSPPETMQLTSGTFRMLAERSLEQGRQLVLPAAPRPESIEDAAYEGAFTVSDEPTVAEPNERDLAIMRRGTPVVDVARERRRWFAIVKGTSFDNDGGRADFLAAWTSNEYDSLSAFLSVSTQEEVDLLMAVVERCVQDGERMPFAYEGFPEVDEPVIDGETGEINEVEPLENDFTMQSEPDDDEPEPHGDEEEVIFLQSLARDFAAATTQAQVRELRDSYKPFWDDFTAEDQAAIRGWQRAAVERVTPPSRVEEQLDGIEQLRKERAARNREMIEASRR